MPKKGGGLGQFANLRGCLTRKRGVVFLRGLIPRCTLCIWLYYNSVFSCYLSLFMYQGIIQKKSTSSIWMLPCLVIFFQNFILIWKCQKWSLNRGTLVSAPIIYQTKCPFTVPSVLFLFFWMLPYDSDYFLCLSFSNSL